MVANLKLKYWRPSRRARKLAKSRRKPGSHAGGPGGPGTSPGWRTDILEAAEKIQSVVEIVTSASEELSARSSSPAAALKNRPAVWARQPQPWKK